MASFYEFRMLNLPGKYKLSPNAQAMLKAHEDWKTAKIDEHELGRLVRLSPENRSAILKTMVKLAGIMQTNPQDSKHCLTMIEICGEIVTIAGKLALLFIIFLYLEESCLTVSQQTSPLPRLGSRPS
jgi:hypothetical protein